MNLKDKIARSKNDDRIDFTKYQSLGLEEALTKVEPSEKLVVEPNWTLENDWEGSRYADYISTHPEYDEIYLRAEVAQRLYEASLVLDAKYKLVIRAGHRPIEVQKRILIDCTNEYKEENSGISDEEALEHARDFISDPDITLPPHVCGAAVDVELVNAATNKLLDFGTIMNDDTEQSFLHYPNLSEEQKNNRMVLLSAMLEAGFASCLTEWWHFSFGDQVWAWFYSQESSLYSPIDI